MKKLNLTFGLLFVTLGIFTIGDTALAAVSDFSVLWRQPLWSDNNYINGTAVVIGQDNDPIVIGSKLYTGDLVITKYDDVTGSIVWHKQFSTIKPINNWFNDKQVVIDEQGNLLLSVQEYFGISHDIKTVKVDGNTGELLWEKNFDGGYHDEIPGVVLDSHGNLIVKVHSTVFTLYPETKTFFRALKYDGKTGALLWNATYQSNATRTYIIGDIAIGQDDNPVLVGWEQNPEGSVRAVKFNGLSGEILWNSAFDGGVGRNIAIGLDNRPVIASEINNGGLATKLDAFTGAIVWQKQFDLDGVYSYNLLINQEGNPVVAGNATRIIILQGNSGEIVWDKTIDPQQFNWQGTFSDLSLDIDGNPIAAGIGVSMSTTDRSALIVKFAKNSGEILAQIIQSFPGAYMHGVDIETGNDGSPVAAFPITFTGGSFGTQVFKYGQSNQPPILSYSQDPGYIDDGINPDEGDINTDFTFKIVYTDLDNDPPTDMRTVVFDGSPSDSPAVEVSSDVMTLDSSTNSELHDGNYTNGEQYVLTRFFLAGVYRYRFQASDGNGPSPILDGIVGGKAQQFLVIENQPPIASFTFTPQNPKVGEQIAFNAASSTDPDGAIVLYGWDWESDGLTDIYSDTPFIQYNGFLAGTHIATLYVTDNKGAVGSISAVVSVAPTNQSTASASILDAFCSAFGGWWCGTTVNQDEQDINTLDEWLRDKDGDGSADPNTTPFDWLKGTKCGGAGTSLKQKECLISAFNTKLTSESGLTYKAYILSVITEQKIVERAFKQQHLNTYKLYLSLLVDWLPFKSVIDIFYNDITTSGMRNFLIAAAPHLPYATADLFMYGTSFLSFGMNAVKLNETFDKLDDGLYNEALVVYLSMRSTDHSHELSWKSCNEDGTCRGPGVILAGILSEEMLSETKDKFNEWYNKYQPKFTDGAFGFGNQFKQDLKKDIKALILFAIKNTKIK